MKLKTKLISVLGATAIAASGISVISSCTYSHQKESYVMPDIRYSGSTEITTEIGQNVGTLSSFFVANRDIYHNEKFTVKAINPTTSAESTDVSAQLINVAKGFKVLITMLNVTPGQVTDAEPVSFKLTFTSTYRAKSYEIPYANTFTINYIPALDSYTATYVGDPSQTITPLTGTRDFAVTYNLNKVLQKNATISNVTTNCPDKVVVKKFEHTKGSLQIKLTLSVLSSDDYTGATETFNPIFTIGYYNTLNDINGTTIKVEYTPLWRDINVLCYGQSIEDPDISFGTILDDNKIDIISQFHLDRVMDNDIESLEISCVDSANLVTLDSWDWHDDKKMDLDIHLLIDDSVITAKKSVPLDFGLKFTITNKVNPFYTPKVFNFTKLSVQWRPSWEWNTVTDMETPDFKADKTTEINVSKRFKLYRKLTGSDEIKVTIPSQETRPDGSNFIECSNYSVIEDGGLYYVDLTLKLNLLQDEIFTSHDYWFTLQFDFSNDGSLKNRVVLPQTSGQQEQATYTLAYIAPEKKTTDYVIPTETTSEAKGYQYFAFDATFTDKNVTYDEVSVTAVAAEPWKEHVSVSSFKYLPNEGKIEIQLQFLIDEVTASAYENHDILTTLHIFGDGNELGDTASHNITLHYIGLENDPSKEQSIESYIHDRSFSLVSYTRPNPSSNWTVNYATAWIINDAPELPTNENVTNSSDYAYYCVTSYEAFKSFRKAYVNAIENNYEIHVGVADYSMQKEYTDSSGKKISGLNFETDYMNLDPYYAFWFPDNFDSFLWSESGDSFKGTADIYVARINFAFVEGLQVGDPEVGTGSAMNIHFKNKLGKIRGWIGESGDGEIINFKPDSTKGDAAWSSDQILQGGFPTKSYSVGSRKTATVAYWFEGWWHQEGTGAFKTRYYAKSTSNHPYDNLYLDDEKQYVHYSPTYYLPGYVNSSSQPLLSSGSMVAYRDENDVINVFAIYWGLVLSFEYYYYGYYSTAFDILAENGKNVLDAYLD